MPLLLKPDARIGIINRGEAAVRFISAVKEYNLLHETRLESVAFYIDSERHALFVKQADRAHPLASFSGFRGLTSSPYLSRPFLIAALKHTGCSAVWVGWGFLSEDPLFAADLEASGIVLLGPSSESMARLGDKIAAKELANRAEVPTTPWSGGPVETLDAAKSAANKIGYPVIIKAANGGGGRGIRKVYQESELAEQFESVGDEIFRFFGNRVVFIEALVSRGRHLEVQCIADHHGEVRTFGVRDCSVQRNNQKIIEETPPADLPAQVMVIMEEAAQRLLKSAAYCGAATVEYLYDIDRGEPYFMEVNTRLQVEHPITEELFGIDMVALQIYVAMGHRLAALPAASARGYVTEVRLNAEDPDQNFAPTPGRVNVFQSPNLAGIRIDTGIEQGSIIPREFDSMIAKIIAKAPTRAAAHAKIIRALQDLSIQIEKGTTNKAFLLELFNSPEVKASGVSTDFVERLIRAKEHQKLRTNWEIAIVAGLIYQYRERYFHEIERFTDKIQRFSSPRSIPSAAAEYTLSHGDQKYTMTVRGLGYRFYHLTYRGEMLIVRYAESGPDIIVFAGEKRHRVQIVPRTTFLQIEVDGVSYPLGLGSGGDIVAPSPSVVLSIKVKPGTRLAKGEPILSLEAMKMEMVVRAPEAGIVKKILVNPGEQVQAGYVLCEIQAEEDKSAKQSTGSSVPLSFASMMTPEQPKPHEIEDAWYALRREFLAHFLGHDAIGGTEALFERAQAFIKEHEDYREKFCQMIFIAIKSYTSIELLFTGNQLFEDNANRGARFEDLMMHFLNRSTDDDGLPQEFRTRLEDAFQWYTGANLSEFSSASRILYHIYRAHRNLTNKSELMKYCLDALRVHYPIVSHLCPRDKLADMLNNLIAVNPSAEALVDNAFRTRYKLIDKAYIEQINTDRHALVTELLSDLLETRTAEDRRQRLNEIISSGHQVVTAILAQKDLSSAQENTALEVIARRFNRDRKTRDGKVVTLGQHKLYDLTVSEGDEAFHSLITILTKNDVLSEMIWLRDFTKSLGRGKHEIVIMIPSMQKSDIAEILEHIPHLDLSVGLLSLGIDIKNHLNYFNFVKKEGQFTESQRRKYLSPLRYRELRIERMDNFKLELVYHSNLVHLMKAEAKVNPKDERLFAFVEIPETRIEFDERGNIKRIVGLEEHVLDALQAMRRHHATKKRRLHWNRIIVHIGHTLPINLSQIGDYPKLLTGLIQGSGIEKMVIYTKTSGRTQASVDTEILLENLNTKPGIRARVPSPKLLQPLSNYDSKVLRCIQRGSVYPYEVIRMITNNTDLDFPSGSFRELDIEVDADACHRIIDVSDRRHGENHANVVFGLVSNTLPDGRCFERVLLLGDPSMDMGSLAEGECRRVIAAIDLAWEKKLPVEWLPISSGAAIGMTTGTENLDWTAQVVKRIVEFTQNGGEINIIVDGINVGAQAYWNAEATMLMHNRGILIMTERGTMLLTGKKALDFSGSVSAEDNIGIGGVEQIMAPNGQAQLKVKDLNEAYHILFQYYDLSYSRLGERPARLETKDSNARNISEFTYADPLGMGFQTVGDILGTALNAERKKPFDTRQIMASIADSDAAKLERWAYWSEAETGIVWHTRLGGHAVTLIGIEGKPLARLGEIPNDGPETWSSGTLYPQSSRKVARAINAASGKLPVVVLANLSGFDGSPESLRHWQLEYGAEIGRAVVNFRGPIVFVVISRYHGGAYVVFSRRLNPEMTVIALENTFASVIGGAPAAAVVFPREVLKNTHEDPRIKAIEKQLAEGQIDKAQYKAVFERIRLEHQGRVAQEFEQIHTVERAQRVGSIDHIVAPEGLRPLVIRTLDS